MPLVARHAPFRARSSPRRRGGAGTVRVGREAPPVDAGVPLGEARYDLAESTVQPLSARALLDIAAGTAALAGLGLGYGRAAGSPVLRQAVALACGVAAEEVVTVPGTMLGLATLASELCRPGEEALLLTPNYLVRRHRCRGDGHLDLPDA